MSARLRGDPMPVRRHLVVRLRNGWVGRGEVNLRTRAPICVETGQVKPATDHYLLRGCSTQKSGRRRH